MKQISSESEIILPASFTCPICGDKLNVEEVDGWELDDDGKWKIDSIKVDCVTFPGFDDHDEFENYMSGHYSMPYVDWMPLEQSILKWVNDNYTWEM